MDNEEIQLIMVLGMHRSGTSVASRGLVTMGVDLRDKLLPPGITDNPRGFWEDRDTLAVLEGGRGACRYTRCSKRL